MKDDQSSNDQFVAIIHQYIENNLGNEKFSVDKLAGLAGLSRSMLHRKLIKLCGKSATDLITEMRLTRAKELLEKDVATVAEIAYIVGFSSPSYFSKLFKKHFNVSPGDVRKGAIVHAVQRSAFYKLKLRVSARLKTLSPLVYFLVILFAVVTAGGTISYFSRYTKPVEKSIAVLPFANLTTEQGNQHFADGIVDDLLDKLSRIDGLKVISRTSSEMYRERGRKTIPQIAKELGVSYIIEGSVQCDKNKARINIQLIDARNDDHIWSNLFDRDLSDIFKIQSEIATKVASELNIILTEQQTSAIQKNYTKSTMAFEYYQMGRFHAGKRWVDGYNKSIEYFEKAIAEDPDYGLAYAGLADTYLLMALQGWTDKAEGADKSRKLALKALELDPDLAEAHTVLGSLYTYIDWNWAKSEKEFLQALKLNPNYSTAHQYYAELLDVTASYNLSRKHINKALELDPFSFVMRFLSGLYFFKQGQFREALAENNICKDLIKDHEWSTYLEFDIYYQLGLEQEALESFKHYGKTFKQYDPALADSVFEKEGMDGLLRVKIRTDPSQNHVAFYYSMLGEYDKSMDILENLYANGKIISFHYFRYEFNDMHNNPRYIKLLEKMGLPTRSI